jgi:hypothetical protein
MQARLQDLHVGKGLGHVFCIELTGDLLRGYKYVALSCRTTSVFDADASASSGDRLLRLETRPERKSNESFKSPYSTYVRCF